MTAPGAPRWPVTLLTGMLGSGKTTLLRRLLAEPSMRGTAVLINEIGEIGLDHHLVERVDGETVLLRSGCLCCTLKADLPQTLAALRRRWLGDAELALCRVVIETTGLADPVPILRELAVNPLIADDFPIASVISTLDARHADLTRPELRAQVASADVLLLTKTDIVPADRTRHLRQEAGVLAPHAALYTATDGVVEAAGGLPALLAPAPPRPLPEFSAHHRHDHGATLAARARTPLDAAALEGFVRALLADGAPGVLRLKGIFDVTGLSGPLVLHAVQELLYGAETLAHWPDADRSSRFVLILDGSADRDRFTRLIRDSGLGWEIPVGS